MKKKVMNTHQLRNSLFERYPSLRICETEFDAVFEAMRDCFRAGGKLLVAGNGGSASDSEHITGELMKSFLFSRRIEDGFAGQLYKLYGEEGQLLASKLEGALPVLPLTSMPALNTAFANDVDAAVSFAQMTYGYSRPGDMLLVISTSGNSKNILYAVMAARANNMKAIGLTGRGGGKCAGLCDICISVPEDETYKIQELHLPVYHTLCAMLEAEFF
jgi:D-sedoheptulose 7-phosphate isomerase